MTEPEDAKSSYSAESKNSTIQEGITIQNQLTIYDLYQVKNKKCAKGEYQCLIW